MNDRDSHRHMVEALKRKNPLLRIWLTVKETSETFGADEIELTLTGHQSATAGPTALKTMRPASSTSTSATSPMWPPSTAASPSR